MVEEFFTWINVDDADLFVDWDRSLPRPETHPNYSLDYNGKPYEAEVVGERFESFESSFRERPFGLMNNRQTELWDRLYQQDKVDEAEEYADAIVERWLGPVHCCVRAGLDLAYSPSMGVLGFTVGDLRKMYPEGVPDWVKGDVEWETIPVTGVVPGLGFKVSEATDSHPFDSIPDNASVWL